MSDKPKAVAYYRVGKIETPQTAIYCRVALADVFAVKAQEELLIRYAAEKKIIVDRIHSDNGESGATLERPAFQKMMSGINTGEISCVIVKDFARLSRNHIQLGEWLNEMQNKNIRIICVNDGYDSDFACDFFNKQFKDVMVELCRKDRSAKIKANLALKKEAKTASKAMVHS